MLTSAIGQADKNEGGIHSIKAKCSSHQPVVKTYFADEEFSDREVQSNPNGCKDVTSNSDDAKFVGMIRLRHRDFAPGLELIDCWGLSYRVRATKIEEQWRGGRDER